MACRRRQWPSAGCDCCHKEHDANGCDGCPNWMCLPLFHREYERHKRQAMPGNYADRPDPNIVSCPDPNIAIRRRGRMFLSSTPSTCARPDLTTAKGGPTGVTLSAAAHQRKTPPARSRRRWYIDDPLGAMHFANNVIVIVAHDDARVSVPMHNVYHKHPRPS
jgi:hypothetical protein